MNYPLISIIVPVYQVEKYLEKCINSILAQTYKNLEIILVDDGSTDNCPAICDRFQSEDSRIKVIHQENGGLSHARNVGMEAATGDFIGFVDSDDWIEPNMYEVLMSALQETGADIAVCDRQIEYEESNPTSNNVIFSKRKIYYNEEALRMLIKGEGIIRNAVWNKLFKKKILQNIKFPEGKISEDLLWTPMIIGNTQFIVCQDSLLYHYLHRVTSLSRNHQLKKKRLYDQLEMLKQRNQYIHDHYPSLEKLSIYKYQNFCLYEYRNISLNYFLFDTDGAIRHELYQQFCQSGSINIQNLSSYKFQLYRILFKLRPTLFLKAYVFVHKLYSIKNAFVKIMRR